MKLKAPTRKLHSKVHKPHLSTVSDARAVRSREKIRNAFLRLLQTHSLEEITVREICAKASLNDVTFFRHYLTKESLLDDIAADEVKQLVALTLPVFNSENTAAAAVTLCTYVDSRRNPLGHVTCWRRSCDRSPHPDRSVEEGELRPRGSRELAAEGSCRGDICSIDGGTPYLVVATEKACTGVGCRPDLRRIHRHTGAQCIGRSQADYDVRKEAPKEEKVSKHREPQSLIQL